MSDFDVIVVGSGAGGAVAAGKFVERGYRVLIVERGHEPADRTLRDHLRNHRYSKYGHNTGPELVGNPRVFVGTDGVAHTVASHEGGYNNVAMGVGGGTRVYGAQAWRFHPLDFRMASTYGVPSESSLADWPIDYEELAPYYESIEWQFGVNGSEPARNLPARRSYPMPPHRISRRGEVLQAAAERLGWANLRVPLMINTVERNGRAACIECQHCVGFYCPVHARGDAHNTALPAALASGRCELWARAQVTELVSDASGKVLGVRMNFENRIRDVRARVIIVAAGAIETARLLLNSRTAREPDGIGNNLDQVGRHLQGHYYPEAQGLFQDPIVEMRGPGPTVSVTEFNHGNEGIVGGGMLADDFLPLPAYFATDFRAPWVPAFGPELKAWVRHAYLRSFRLIGPVQDIPSPTSRVTLDTSVRDAVDTPVARLQGTTHPETVRTATFMAAKAREWMQEAGADQVWSRPVGLHLSAGQHQAGTCRMGDDPRTSVVNSQGRVHGHENVLICDASVHVTNGGFNPFLTIMATALRTATLFEKEG